ncbi:MAG: BrnA antitoxin family protein [Novosphingobium sp.]
MSESEEDLIRKWMIEDDAPELTDEMVKMGQFSIGDKIIRPATGVLTKDGMKAVPAYTIPMPVGRPPERDEPKKQVTLRLDADLIERFRAGGAGWQSRINATLRKAVGI